MNYLNTSIDVRGIPINYHDEEDYFEERCEACGCELTREEWEDFEWEGKHLCSCCCNYATSQNGARDYISQSESMIELFFEGLSEWDKKKAIRLLFQHGGKWMDDCSKKFIEEDLDHYADFVCEV